MNDSSNFISHILNIVHFQGIICTFLYSFQKRNIMELPIINGPRYSSYLSIVKNLDIKERKEAKLPRMCLNLCLKTSKV